MVHDNKCSNHLLIFLQIVGIGDKPPSPFKFNLLWLEDLDFINLLNANCICYNIDM
jgi:hypothetical protein